MAKSVKKGFTLVELLVVISVLSVILLVAIPLVSNVVEENKKSAAVTSAYNFIRAINSELLNQSSNINEIDNDKLIPIGDYEISYFKDKIDFTNAPDAGHISIGASNVVVEACLEIFGYRIDYDGMNAVVNENKNTCGSNSYVNIQPCLDANCEQTGDVKDPSTWLATYYTVTYVNSTDPRETNYEFVLEDLPIETKNIYRMDLVKSGVMTTIDDFETFAELSGMKAYDIDSNSDESVIKEEPKIMLQHAAGEEHISIDEIDIYCGNANCVADIYESLQNLETITPATATTSDGNYLEQVIYIPIKFTVKITKGNVDGYVYPKFEQDLEVKFNSNGGTKIDTQTVSYYDKAVRPTNDPTRSGYKFITWNLDGVEYDFNSYVTKSITLDAVWEKYDTYDVTYDSNGGTKVSSQTIISGKTAWRPSTPTRTGYKFDCWTLDGVEYNFSTPVTKNITLVARWKDAVTVTFNTNGGSYIAPKEVTINTKVTKPSPPPTKYDYQFNYWTLSGTEYDFNTLVTEDITLDAVWRDALLVTFDSNGGSKVPYQYPAFISRDTEDAIVVKPANPTKTGYAFVRWELNGVEFNFSKTISTDITLKAVWEKTYNVSFDSNGGSRVSTQKIRNGTTATKPSLATRCGYALKYWTLDGEPYDFSTPVTSDIHLVAEWESASTYEVKFDSNGGTSVTTQCIPMNSKASYKKSTRSGYNFLGWLLDGEQFDFNTPITKDITLKANWEEKYNTNYGEVYVAPTKSYTLTYYTAGYITDFDSQIISYTIDLNDFPSSYSSYLLDSTKINSIYVKGIDVVKDFEQMRGEVGDEVNVISLNQNKEWVTASLDDVKKYALDSSHVSVEAQFNCTSGCTMLTIDESIADVNNEKTHSTKTRGNKAVEILYIPLAITIKIEIGEGSSLALKIAENNEVLNPDNLDYTQTNYYPSEYKETTNSSSSTYSFISDQHYWFGTDYMFDTKTGIYTVSGTASSTYWSDTVASKFKYFCGSTKATKQCDSLYEIVGYVDATTANVIVHDRSPVSYASNGDGLFEKDGVLFFRGDVRNNYLQFAGYNWRIVRINEDGTIRIITSSSIGSSAFNSGSDDNAYVGYMYGAPGSANYNLTHANNNSSTIKKFLDDWFVANLEVHSAAIADSGFCGDRSLHSQNGYTDLNTGIWPDFSTIVNDTGKGYKNYNTMYGSYYRMYYGEPTFDCTNEDDLYSVSKLNGNGRLTYPIGLLSSDELMHAAGYYSVLNRDYYLFLDNEPWWTMSPFIYESYSGTERAAIVLGDVGVSHASVTSAYAVRPVINLDSDVITVKGDGTASSPYVVN